MSDCPLIDIQDATVFRGRSKVFDRLSLRIDRGEQVAILGPNGAGKTTLLKLISRELYPAADGRSRVRILGSDTWNVWELRKRLGLVSDDLHERYDRRTLGRDVVLSGFFSSIGTHGIIAQQITAAQRSAADAAMETAGIAELAATPLARMSTGQRRRCLLARGLVHAPDTLILDEPTSGLDLAASFDYQRRIQGLIDQGHGMVVVTHRLHEIPPAIERLVLMANGRIVADGTKAQVLTSENLERAYGVSARVTVVDGYYFATPTDL